MRRGVAFRLTKRFFFALLEQIQMAPFSEMKNSSRKVAQCLKTRMELRPTPDLQIIKFSSSTVLEQPLTKLREQVTSYKFIGIGQFACFRKVTID